MNSDIASMLDEGALWMSELRPAEGIRQRLSRNGAWIYGAGGYGRQVAAALAARDIAVHGFIDGGARPGQTLDGVPVVSRDDVPAADAAEQSAIIAINNYQADIGEVAAWTGATFGDTVFVPELPDAIDPALGNYWQGARNLVRHHADQVLRLHGLLADETSRQVLAQLVNYRMRAAPQFHPAVDRENQYFARDILLPRHDLAVIDCGAWPGDMVGSAHAAGHQVAHWYAFEPDPANFAQLATVAREAKLPGASLFPCGVGDRTGMVSFAAGSADASRAIDDSAGGAGAAGATAVPIVRVDDVIEAERIDLVKLDIEGFEAQALAGMAHTLDRHRPRLCMAIYHKPADLWELPLAIAAQYPGARLAIRQHGYNGYDTVLYADL